MSFIIGYAVFGLIFVGSIVGYWVATRPLRAGQQIYVQEASGRSSRGSA